MTMKKYEVTIEGQVYQVTLKELTAEEAEQMPQTAAPSAAPAEKPAVTTTGSPVVAPMAGTILSIKVKLGETVKKGDTLCVLEAMKMETPVLAPADGKVASIEVSENQTVESNQQLLAI
ncbi:biotin/lipoyl-containing protein [Enterococcus devriesei]|uniref:biotin/lipoyl-containing protein n=1 Tax=Enterococcus devriesei TaxID=319970 RepID=UPI0028AEA09B|nr:biotin/lipoyl-containing protein [Enterococcus devriesei]